MSFDQDPFETAAPIASNFASVQSFRGRLILIEPLEKDRIASKQDKGKMQDRVIANVTVVDGNGPVKVFNDGEDTGRTLEGPVFRKVWITQEILIGQLERPDGSLRKLVLTRVDTKTPGTKAKQGNPWGFAASVSEEDKQTARDFLAKRTIDQAAEDENPFG